MLHRPVRGTGPARAAGRSRGRRRRCSSSTLPPTGRSRLGGLICILLVPLIAGPAGRGLRGEPERGARAAILRALRGHGPRPGPALGQSVLHEAPDLAAGAQLRDRALQGERHRRQPDRDGGGRGLEGGRYRRGDLRGGRLRQLRARPERVGGPQPGDPLSLRHARGGGGSRCAATRRRSPGSCRRRSRGGCTRPASR